MSYMAKDAAAATAAAQAPSLHPSLGENGKNKEWLCDSPQAGGEAHGGERNNGEGVGGGVSLHSITYSHTSVWIQCMAYGTASSWQLHKRGQSGK